ncbi:DUF2795 domain-containing protein [Actinomadura fibrosa]|uniref:DUF2795 domain-containing protein n=1 Tax=Actinomadura fibrosa TaxID=111802 RepID=A0ABW2XR92_9ACTN|nr:DUF2795 domain-containing protein [Actinomadura fibrosa]
MRIADTWQVEKLLGDLAFPASKQDIAEHAHRRAPGTQAERALASLPLGTYDNVAEVVRSVPIDPDPDRGTAERVYQRHHHERQGLAEHMRESERPPVQDELERGEGGA